MRIILLLFVFIPFLSIGQLSKKDKKSIDKYAVSMCDCVNDMMSTLHPKVIEVIILMNEIGQEEAMKKVEIMLADMEPEEMQEFIASFTTMESEEFMEEVEACDKSNVLEAELKEQIDNAEGDAHDYLLEVLDSENACKVMKALYDLGASEEE